MNQEIPDVSLRCRLELVHTTKYSTDASSLFNSVHKSSRALQLDSLQSTPVYPPAVAPLRGSKAIRRLQLIIRTLFNLKALRSSAAGNRKHLRSLHCTVMFLLRWPSLRAACYRSTCTHMQTYRTRCIRCYSQDMSNKIGRLVFFFQVVQCQQLLESLLLGFAFPAVTHAHHRVCGRKCCNNPVLIFPRGTLKTLRLRQS